MCLEIDKSDHVHSTKKIILKHFHYYTTNNLTSNNEMICGLSLNIFLHKNKFLQLIQSLFWFDFDLINAYKSFHWVPVWVFSLGTGESRTLPVISPFWLAWVVIDNRMGQRSLTPSYILDNSLWISTVREKCQRSPNHFSSHSSPRIPLLLPEVRQIQNI